MKKIFKYIGIFVLIVLGIFVGLVILIILSVLSTENEGNGSENVIIEYNGTDEIPNFEQPPPIYADTMEEAIAVSADSYFGENSYMSVVSEVIKTFENDEYAAMFYHTIRDSRTEGEVASKFKIKIVDGKKQYALVWVQFDEARNGQLRDKPLRTVRQAAPLYDYLAVFSINEGNRFIYGSLGTEKVKTLKIEGQIPTEVIEYICLGEKEYFWYYENLISDKPSSEFDIEIEE